MATIKKRGQSYQIRVYCGYDADGKQIEKTKTWKPPEGWTERRAEKEAQRLAALFEEQVRSGGLVDGNIKFSEFSSFWLKKYAEPNLKPKTVARYKGLLVRINQNLGYLPINKIYPGNLLEFYQTLAEETPQNAVYRCKVNLKKKTSPRQLFVKGWESLRLPCVIYSTGKIFPQEQRKLLAKRWKPPFSHCFPRLRQMTNYRRPQSGITTG